MPTPAPSPAPTPGPTDCRCVFDYGYAQNYGNFHYNEDGLLYGSLAALNIDANTLSDGFTWYDYLAAEAYENGLYIDGTSYDGRCIYREEPDPTAAPTNVPVPAPTLRPTPRPVPDVPGEPTVTPTPAPKLEVTLPLKTVLQGVNPTSFNNNVGMQDAFELATLATLDDVERIENIVAVAADSRRRRLDDATGSTISFDAIAVFIDTANAAAMADLFLEDTTTALSAAVSSGSLMTEINTQAAIISSGTADNWSGADFDVAASLALIDEAEVSFTVSSPMPSPMPSPLPTRAPTVTPPAGSDDDEDDGGGGVVIIIVIVLVVVLAAGAGAFFMMKKGGDAGGAKILASPSS